MFEFFAKSHKLAQVFTIGALIIGIYAVINIQKERFPNVDFEIVMVNTVMPNSSPSDVESGITDKLEDELLSVDGIEKITSISEEGISNIIINLDQDAKNIDKVKQDIKSAINGVSDLDENAESPIIIEIETSKIDIVKINFSSNISYQDLYDIVDNFRIKLEVVSGVADIVVDGEIDTEVKIYVDPEKLANYKLSIASVIGAIKNRNFRYTAGDNNKYIDSSNIVVLAKFEELSTLKNLILKSNFNGQQVLLSDIATITKGLKEKKNITRVDGNTGFVLNIKKKANADIIKTVDRVRSEVTKLQKNLNEKVNIFYTDDLSKDVRNRLSIVQNNGIMGFIMVLLVLGIFLSIKTAFWVAIGMSVSLLGAVSLLLFFGETINLISLAAIVLVLGIVVDDSIIVAESIQTELEKDNSYKSVIKGYKRVIKSVVATIITSILAIGSMFLMDGTMGKFIYVIPVVVIFALLFSLLEVSIGLPAHLGSGKITKSRVWFKYVESWFLQFISKVLARRYIVVVGFFALAIGTIVFAKYNVEFSLFPAKGSNTISVVIKTSVNGSLENTDDISLKIEKIITNIVGDNLDFIGSEISNSKSKIQIRLIPATDRDIGADEIMKELQAKTKNIVGVESINFSIRRPGPSTGRDIEFQIISRSDVDRKAVAKIIYNKLNTISGVSDIDRNDENGKNRVEIIFNFAIMAKLGVEFISVQNYLNAAFSGVSVITNRIKGRDVDYRLFIGNGSADSEILHKIKISNNTGRLIDFTDFASTKNIIGEGKINHFNGVRAIEMSASVDDKKTSSSKVVKEILSSIDIDNNFPSVRLLIKGGAKDSNEAMNSFKIAFLMSLVGIFFVLMLLFNSYTQPLMVLTSVPFSLIGVVWAFYFHGEFLSFFTILGSLALIGVIVNDSLVMTSHLNDVKNEIKDINDSPLKWIAKGSTDRLRAVVLTSITTLAGVIPLAYGIGGTDFLLQPMVLALGYGLLFGTVTTLVLLPCLYMINYEIVRYFSRVVKRY